MKKILLLLLGLTAGLSAQAEIYKHVDENGRVTYSDRPIKGSVKLDIEDQGATAPGERPARATPTPSNFPRVDKSEQKARDGKRRQILEDELAAERRALDATKEAYAEVQKHPEEYSQKLKGGGRNMAKYDEKLKQLSEEIKTHQDNIEMLELELSRL